MKASVYLSREKEDLPDWLQNPENREDFNYANFFSSRVVFYPGSGFDGHPIRLFASTHSAHCFVYADYMVTEDKIKEELSNCSFRGYRLLQRHQLEEHDLSRRGWVQHIPPDWIGRYRGDMHHFVRTRPYGFLDIYERNPELDDTHGAFRFAIIFLGSDGIAAYDALFCQAYSMRPPFAMMLQDHGFGGNYDKFGDGGLLERIAVNCNVYPEYMLVAKRGTRVWDGYIRVSNKPTHGGMHSSPRFLYRHCGIPMRRLIRHDIQDKW